MRADPLGSVRRPVDFFPFPLDNLSVWVYSYLMTTNNAAAAKNAAISARILALIAEGMNSVEACKTVLGADVVDQMIDTLYTELRTKVAQ